MPTTPTYGLPYPVLSDPPNVPGDLQALAEATDTALADQDSAHASARASLVPTPYKHTLTDITTTPTESTYTQWGTDLVIPNPGKSVAIMVWGMGHVLNDGSGTQNRMRLGISTSGGATVDWGPNSTDQAGGGASTRRGSLSPIHMLGAVLPTGDLVIRAQAYWVGTGGTPQFHEGYITALVIPQ